MIRHRIALPAALAAILAVFAAAPAQAQISGFGKNKIQYEDFQWEILAGENVDLYYYPEERELALIALAEAERAFDDLVIQFSYHPKDRIPLVVYASHTDFEQTNIVPFFLPEGVADVMVKITGRTRDGGHLGCHLDYISRNGALALEGPDGERLRGRDAVRESAACASLRGKNRLFSGQPDR